MYIVRRRNTTKMRQYHLFSLNAGILGKWQLEAEREIGVAIRDRNRNALNESNAHDVREVCRRHEHVEIKVGVAVVVHVDIVLLRG